MNLSEISFNTPKVLDHCLDLFNNDTRSTEPRSIPSSSGDSQTPAKYASHPDIQFFSAVKAKHHFAYHNSKRAKAPGPDSEYIQSKNGVKFDPFSQVLLLERLSTYTALNWSLPFFKQHNNQLTELFCSSHGWKCEPSTLFNDVKNSLLCTGCSRRVTLTFNSLADQPEYAPSVFDVSDIQELNVRLSDSYMDQIKLTAHSSSCPWRIFPCPVKGTYYPIPHISSTDDQLISRYLALLLRSHTNLAIMSHYSDILATLVPVEVLNDAPGFIEISNAWLLSRYFKDTKENLGPVLEKTFPSWAYILAAMGWELVVETFASSSVPILVCSMCNQRVFISNIGSVDLHGKDELDSENTVYKDGLNKVLNSFQKMSPEENVFTCHKPWCVHLHDFGGVSYFRYFHDMLSEANLGPDGQYQNTSDDFLESMDIEPERTKRGMDVAADLERFVKLRKIYFAEDS